MLRVASDSLGQIVIVPAKPHGKVALDKGSQGGRGYAQKGAKVGPADSHNGAVALKSR